MHIRPQNKPYDRHIKCTPAPGWTVAHSEVPVELEGNGICSALIELSLIDISLNSLTLIPLFPFVALYIKRNPK